MKYLKAIAEQMTWALNIRTNYVSNKCRSNKCYGTAVPNVDNVKTDLVPLIVAAEKVKNSILPKVGRLSKRTTTSTIQRQNTSGYSTICSTLIPSFSFSLSLSLSQT